MQSALHPVTYLKWSKEDNYSGSTFLGTVNFNRWCIIELLAKKLKKNLTIKVNRNYTLPAKFCYLQKRAAQEQQNIKYTISSAIKLKPVGGQYIWTFNFANVKKLIFLHQSPPLCRVAFFCCPKATNV